jgi:hypothetical protein
LYKELLFKVTLFFQWAIHVRLSYT